jgi:hypothetical protein
VVVIVDPKPEPLASGHKLAQIFIYLLIHVSKPPYPTNLHSLSYPPPPPPIAVQSIAVIHHCPVKSNRRDGRMATKRNVFVYDGRVMLLDDPILVAGMEQLGHTTAEDFYCYLEMCFEVPRPGQFLLKLDEMVVLPRDDAI